MMGSWTILCVFLENHRRRGQWPISGLGTFFFRGTAVISWRTWAWRSADRFVEIDHLRCYNFLFLFRTAPLVRSQEVHFQITYDVESISRHAGMEGSNHTSKLPKHKVSKVFHDEALRCTHRPCHGVSTRGLRATHKRTHPDDCSQRNRLDALRNHAFHPVSRSASRAPGDRAQK